MDTSAQKPAGKPIKETLLQPPSKWDLPDLRELWHARSLVGALVASELRARYRQTVIGLLWGVLQPFAAMVVFSFLFGQLGAFASDGVPYPLFFFSGFLIWQFFQKAVGLSVPSLASNSHLVAKVYFPRLAIVIFPVLSALIELAFSGVVLAGLFVFFKTAPGPAILVLPAFIFLTAMIALAVAVWLAPLNVLFRDVQVALPSLLQLGFFITPIVYTPTALAESARFYLMLNPLSIAISGARWSLLGTQAPSITSIVFSVAITAGVLLSGLFIFQRISLTMVDRL